MSDKTKRIIRRLFRAAISIAIAGAAVKFGDNPYYLAVGPGLMTAGKALREAFGWKWIPV